MSKKNPRLLPIEALAIPVLLGRNRLHLQWLLKALGFERAAMENVLAMRRGLPEATMERLRALVLHTITHQPPESFPEAAPSSWELRSAIARNYYSPIAHLVGLEPERSKYPALSRQPRAHVVIDRMVLRARFKSEAHQHEFVSKVRSSDPAHAGSPVPLSMPSMDHRPDILAHAQRADMEMMEAKKRHLRFRRIVDIKSGAEVLAKLAWGPFRKRCRTHRKLPLRPSGCTCSTSSRATTWNVRCRCCCVANWCSDCEKLTDAQLDVRIDVTGAACHQGLDAAVLRALFVPFVDADSIEVMEIHVALDFERPVTSLLVLPPKGTRTKQVPVIVSMVAGHHWTISQEVRRNGCSVILYDKLAQERDRAEAYPRRARAPHMIEWDYATRCELRLRPKDRRVLFSAQSPWVDELMRCAASWSIADLTSIEQLDIESAMLALARILDFTLVEAERRIAMSKSRAPGTVRLRHPDRRRDREIERRAKREQDEQDQHLRSFVEIVREAREEFGKTRGRRSSELYVELLDEVRASGECVAASQGWSIEDILRTHLDAIVARVDAALGVTPR